jgi:hypothetical protein
MSNNRMLSDWKPALRRAKSILACPILRRENDEEGRTLAGCLGKTVAVEGSLDDLDNW